MADENDDTLDERLGTIQRRAESFRELLNDGDEVTIACEDGELHVEESYRSKFERKHPKLFGRMLAMEAQMDAGYFPYLAALLLAGGFLFGLQLNWWDGILGETVCTQLTNWWFYIVAPCVLTYLARLGCAQWEKNVYRRNRQALFELIAADQVDRDVLLVTLRGDAEVDNVLYQLKLDTASAPQASG